MVDYTNIIKEVVDMAKKKKKKKNNAILTDNISLNDLKMENKEQKIHNK